MRKAVVASGCSVDRHNRNTYLSSTSSSTTIVLQFDTSYVSFACLFAHYFSITIIIIIDPVGNTFPTTVYSFSTSFFTYFFFILRIVSIIIIELF